MSETFDTHTNISFRLGENDPSNNANRRTFRTVARGVKIMVHGIAETFSVNDISAGGFSMTVPDGRFREGDILTVSILIADRRYINNLAAKVVRNMGEKCACAFQRVARNQEMKLDKLVLEMQKRFIALRKKEQEAAAAEARKKATSSEGTPIFIHLE